MANPASMRLVAWFGLEQELANPASRAEAVAEQERLIGLAQQRGTVTSAFPPGFLMTVIMVLAAGWSAGSPFGPTMDPDATNDPHKLRDMIAATIARLARPAPDETLI
jgi:Tetracyclin repressor-like, C-terminal domain